jgi:hypothetical protein
MKALLYALLALVLFLIGCVSPQSPRAQAAARAAPFVAALKAYHRDTGDYPWQLDELGPHYVSAKVPLYDARDLEHLWRLEYQRVSADDYSLALYSAPCSQVVFDKEGKCVAAGGPNFK